MLQGCAERIKDRVRKSLSDVVVIGKELTEAKDKLPHGAWLPWLEAEFGWKKSTAYQFIAVATKFPNSGSLPIAPSAAYLLAAPKTPDSVREQAIALAQNGTVISHEKVREMVAACSRARLPLVPAPPASPSTALPLSPPTASPRRPRR